MNLVDIGINLANHQFENDYKDVVQRAYENHVNHILLTTVDSNSFFKNLSLIEETFSLQLHTTWGLHPHNAKNLQTFIEETFFIFEKEPLKIKAIGEFGLDFFRMISTSKEQEAAMHYFLEIGKKYPKLPFFLHERQAIEQFCGIYKEHISELSNSAVIHCFTGNKAQLKQYLDLGFYIGITGWICDERRGIDLQDALKYIPNNQLMIETDSPYLKPRTIKNKSIRNEPAFLYHILKQICEIKGMPVEELGEIIYNNSIQFFNLNS